jgi:hypothetical protein
MSIKINKRLFDLEQIYEFLSHSSTIFGLDELFEFKDEITDEIKRLEGYLGTSDENQLEKVLGLIEQLYLQLEYLNKNIDTFKSSLILHEAKIIKKIKVLDIPGEICLN